MKFLDTKQIFESIRELSSNADRRVYAAVAFVGKESYNLFSENIRNVEDIRFIVNFSESSVKNGLTNPYGINQLQDFAEVRNNKNLHAKIYIFDDTALICSANLSRHATTNIEAGISINRKDTVEEIVRFFERLWKESKQINKELLIKRIKIWKKIGNKRAIQMVSRNNDLEQKIKINRWKNPIPPTLQIKLKELPTIKNRKYFYIMHLSYNGDMRKELWDYAKDNNLIGLSHQEVDEWTEDRESIINEKRLKKGWIGQFDLFCSIMKKGDIVLILDGERYLLGVAEVSDNKHKLLKIDELEHDFYFFDHVREVIWIEEHEYDERRRLPQQIGFKNTLNMVKPGHKRWKKLENFTIYI
ncbi:phospholipase D-like domain-containing protein [Candidatus Pyrohabitans sp.]